MILKKGSRGHEVVALKGRLRELGYWPVLSRRTSLFDDRTHAAVVWFQLTHYNRRGLPLVGDGVVGPATRWALTNPGKAPRAYDRDPTLEHSDGVVGAISPVHGELVHIARGYVGVREEPLGSNRGPEVDQFIPRWRRFNPGPAWCAFFVSAVDNEATRGYTLGRRHGSCEKMYAAARKRDMTIPVNEMAPGDLFFLSNGERLSHVGFCYRFGGGAAGPLNTIEGNSGHRVALGQRNSTDVAAAVRLWGLSPGKVGALQSLPLVSAPEASTQTR